MAAIPTTRSDGFFPGSHVVASLKGALGSAWRPFVGGALVFPLPGADKWRDDMLTDIALGVMAACLAVTLGAAMGFWIGS